MAASGSEALARGGRATYQDVLDAPAHLVAEIINGTLYTHPRPSPAHTIASSVLGGELNPPFHRGRGGPGGWWILNEPELHLGDEVLVPDLAGWRRERMPEPPDTAYFSVAPDWCVRGAFGVDAPCGPSGEAPGLRPGGCVGHLWLIEPTDRTLEAFELRDGEWVLIACAKDDEPVSVRPFDAITFSLGDLWA